MRETGNINTDCFETVENFKRVYKMWETESIYKETVSCDDSGKEEQISNDCGHEWYCRNGMRI